MSVRLSNLLAELRREALEQGFHEEIYGSTKEWPLFAWLREEKNAPTIYLSSGMHGDEPAPVEAMLAIFRAGLLDERFSWRVCPALNPVGLSRGTRENGEGIDLNRDYLLQESKEVRAHRAWLEAKDTPVMFLSLHEDWESTGFYYYEIASQRDDRIYPALRKTVEEIMPMEPSEKIDDHGTREPGWIYHPASPDFPENWPEAIFLAKQGCPRSYTLETPSSLPMAKRVETHVAAVGFLLEQAEEFIK